MTSWNQPEITKSQIFYPKKPSDVGPGRQFMIVEFTTVYFEGDERSRTHPGHGYPAHTETYANLLVFKNEEAMKNWILTHEDASYIALDASPIKVEKTITISLKETT